MSNAPANNPGTLVGTVKPAAVKADAANPPEEISVEDALQMFLDLAGLIPGLGAFADLANAGISAWRGDFWGALFSIGSAVPLVGDAAGLAKIVAKGEKYLQAIAVVEKKVLSKLPAGLKKKFEDAIAKMRAKLEELMGKTKKKEPPPPPPPPPPPGAGSKGDGKGKPDKDCPNCPSKGPPVNPVTGAKVLSGDSDLDFTLPGALPLAWQRFYLSSNPLVGWFGQGFSSPLEVHLRLVNRGVDYRDEYGRKINFNRLAKGERIYSRHEQSTLSRGQDGVYQLELPDGLFLRFGHTSKQKGQTLHLLSAMADRSGNLIVVERTDSALPRYVHSSSGQVLELVFTEQNLLAQVNRLDGLVPGNPAAVGRGTPERIEASAATIQRVVLARYAYDTNDDLRQVFNRAGELVREFGWLDHLMIAHRTTGVFESHYEYEGQAEALVLPPQRIRLTPESRVVKQWSNSGLGFTVTYDDAAQTSTVIDQDQLKSIYSYILVDTGTPGKPLKRWVATTDAQGNKSSRTVDSYGSVLSVTDAAGASTGYGVNAQGRPTSITDPNGGTTRLQWDAALGKVTSVSDPLGRTSRFVYDARGNLSEEINADGVSTHYDYDGQGQVVAIIDAHGGRKSLERNALGLVTRYTDCSHQATTFEYSADGWLLATTNALGHSTTYQYDAAGRLISQTQPGGSIEAYQYDAAGRLISHTDALGAVTRYQLAVDGQPTCRTDALGHSLRYEYAGSRQLATLINENNARYTFAYDSVGRLIAETDFGGKATTYQYDAAGHLVEQTEAPDSASPITTRFERDALGRLLLKTTGLVPSLPSTITSFSYDAAGQLLEATNPSARVRLEYDRLGRLTAEHSTASAFTSAESALNTIKSIAANIAAAATTAQITAINAKQADAGDGSKTPPQPPPQPPSFASPSSALAQALQRLYAPLDNEANQTNQTSQTFSLQHRYDDLGNRTATVLPDGRTINTLYYGSGHAHQINISNGNGNGSGQTTDSSHQLITDLDRDALHRETQRSQGSLSTGSTYDPQGRLQAQQARRTAQIDARLRPEAAQSATKSPNAWQDGAAIARRYQYDAAGNLVQQQDWARPTAYAYDPLGQLLAASSANAQERFAFDPAHNLLPATASSSTDAEKTTTSAPAPVLNNRITVFEDKRYSYDRHGRVTQRLSGSANNQTQLTLAWDDEHQLVSAKSTKTRDAKQTTQITHYHYDAFGRRISKAGEFGQTRFLWDGNRLLQERRGSNTSATTHVTTTVYEPESFVPLAQLAWTEDAKQQAQTSQQPNYTQRTGTHDEILGGLDQALAGVDGYKVNETALVEYQKNSGKQPPSTTTAYLTSTNTGTVNLQSATIDYYHCDQIGTPRELTDELGAVTWSATYKAWGRVEKEQSYKGLSLAARDGEITNEYASSAPQTAQTHQPLRFQGQYYDAETGLHYNRFRYYEPQAGFYICEDPIALAGGTNTYRYVWNPLVWVDPLGLAGNKPACPICCDESTGRSNKQARLLELASDPKQPAWVRGWIKNELRHIATGNRSSIRLPGNSRNSRSPGKELAHGRGTEAKDGYCYLHSLLQDADLHKLQHKIGGY